MSCLSSTPSLKWPPVGTGSCSFFVALSVDVCLKNVWLDTLLDGCCDKLRLCSLSEKKPVLAIWPLDHVQQISEMEETRPQDRGVPYNDNRYSDTKNINIDKVTFENMKKYELLRIFLEQMQENTICLVGVRTGGYYYSRGQRQDLLKGQFSLRFIL